MRVSKKQTRQHDRLMAMLSSSDRLSVDQIESFYDDFVPSSMANTTKLNAFFTPQSVAQEISVFCDCDGSTVLDLAAGIGSLSYGILSSGRKPKRVVAIEINPEFVKIGKRLLPEVEWICGDIFDATAMKRLGRFDWVISNPPFNVPMPPDVKKDAGPVTSDLAAVVVALTVANDGMFILPQKSTPWKFSGRQTYECSNPPTAVRRFMDRHPSINFYCVSCDLAYCKDDWQDGITMPELVHITNYTE